MKRRTVLQGMASVAALSPLSPLAPLGAFAQSPTFSPAELTTLKAAAEVLFPSTLTARERDAVVGRFAAWFLNYRAGADRGHSYGDSRLSAPAPALNITRYPTQIAALEKAARDQGAASFSALPVAKRRPIIETALNDPQLVNRLSARPSGANVVADLMGFYFSSPAAMDLCYKAAIGRDECRGLPGSDKAPAPIILHAGGVEEF
jgi:hypothetical protein